MALRDQPYLPLYVDRYSSDEKLRECSAAANGVLIRLMLYLHKVKTDIYGVLPLKKEYADSFAIPKGKASATPFGIANGKALAKVFAIQLAKHLPYPLLEIENGLVELYENKVIFFKDFNLCQNGMIKQGKISDSRKDAGNKGVLKKLEKSNKKNKFAIPNGKPFGIAKDEANPITITTTITSLDNEGGIGNEYGVQGEKKLGGEEDKKTNGIIKIENNMINQTYEVGEFLKIYFTSPKYSMTRELLAASKYIDILTLKEWAKLFNNYLISSGGYLDNDGRTVKQENDWTKHFSFWLATQNTSTPIVSKTKNQNKTVF